MMVVVTSTPTPTITPDATYVADLVAMPEADRSSNLTARSRSFLRSLAKFLGCYTGNASLNAQGLADVIVAKIAATYGPSFPDDEVEVVEPYPVDEADEVVEPYPVDEVDEADVEVEVEATGLVVGTLDENAAENIQARIKAANGKGPKVPTGARRATALTDADLLEWVGTSKVEFPDRGWSVALAAARLAGMVVGDKRFRRAYLGDDDPTPAGSTVKVDAAQLADLIAAVREANPSWGWSKALVEARLGGVRVSDDRWRAEWNAQVADAAVVTVVLTVVPDVEEVG